MAREQSFQSLCTVGPLSVSDPLGTSGRRSVEKMKVALSVLAVGMAGLLWPEKVKPVFEFLMFPWFPSYRALRVHSVATIGLSFLLFLAGVMRLR